MLEMAEKKYKIDKIDYETEIKIVREKLLELQQQLDKSDTAIIILLAGVDGSGKGDILAKLNEWLDPRYMRTHAYSDMTDDEKLKPRHWRYWMNMPAYGRLSLEVFGWYGSIISDRLRGVINETETASELMHINKLEKTLVDNKIILIKFWLHLSQDQQVKKIRKLSGLGEKIFRPTESEERHLKQYPEFIKIADHILSETNSEVAKWIILNGYDANYRRLQIGKQLIKKISEVLQVSKLNESKLKQQSGEKLAETNNILATVNLSSVFAKTDYQRRLAEQQNCLSRITNVARHSKIGAIMVFEGWDASGKGGVIRRITAALDARNYNVIPISAPNDEENSHHYLWRFWKHLPKDGNISIYDRSWYGRVLVERVENLIETEKWMRAYSEINEFENELVEHGIILLKFWLHISKEEQLKRFRVRENTSYKRYKITQDDYRNREKWDNYEIAVNDMIMKTDTQNARWNIISAEDKYTARISVLDLILKSYNERLAK